MIWDILRIAAFQCSKRRNAHVESFPRRAGYNHFCSEDFRDMSLLDEVLEKCENKVEENDENSGVSVVLIESRLKQENEPRE